MNFGRQPLPITVTLDGDPIDVEYWMREFMQRAEFKGDLVIRHLKDSTRFNIYPRAVND